MTLCIVVIIILSCISCPLRSLIKIVPDFQYDASCFQAGFGLHKYYGSEGVVYMIYQNYIARSMGLVAQFFIMWMLVCLNALLIVPAAWLMYGISIALMKTSYSIR